MSRMDRMTRLAATAALVATTAAFALPAEAQSFRLTDAWDAALSEEQDYLEPDELAEINMIAYHGAVAKLCAGFEVDVAEIATASNAVIVGATEGLADQALFDRTADVLLTIGTAHGLFLAEGSLHAEDFCADAAETRDDPSFDDHWK